MQTKGKGISHPHSYRSLITYYTPETAHITFNVREMRKLRRLSNEAFIDFIFIPIFLHELEHFSQLAKNPPGVILNFVKIRLENVKALEEVRSDNIAEIKERILKNEILWNKLFIASYPIVEALVILFMKEFYNKFISSGKFAEIIWHEAEKQHYQKLFKKFANRLESRILKKIPNLSKKRFKEVMEKVWKKIDMTYIGRIKENMERVFDLFIKIALTKNEIREVYEDLEWLSSQSSFGFAYFISFFSLDIPLFNSSDLENIDELDLQHNPIQRFKLLISKLKELNEKEPLREIEIQARYRSLPKIWGKLVQFVKQLVELEVFDPRERIKIMKEIPFKHLRIKIQVRRMGKREVKHTFRLAKKYLNVKNLVDFFKNFVEKFVSMPIVIREDGKEHLILNKEYMRDKEWKFWWCKNGLIIELKYGEKLRDPLQIYSFALGVKRVEKLKHLYEVVKKMNEVEVKSELIEELTNTNQKIRKITGIC
ncbi:MAG: hypothetical protein QXV82_10355 [Ignisphaera sp.]